MQGLRRLGANFSRSSVASPLPMNDDEEERREARRQTLLQSANAAERNKTEESEIDTCLEVCNNNKLNRENAWKVSLIDTVAKLIERHNSKLKNLKVAGSTLEASCKVYGMRVDSIHTDVLRMTAGLGTKESEQQKKDAENEGVGSQNAGDGEQPKADEGKKRGERRRTRKALSTVTKNRETLNGRIETVPPIDPIFAKLNSTTSSINASNRLMNNILPTSNSELLLNREFPPWRRPCPEPKDYTQVQLPQNDKAFDCTQLLSINFEDYQLRPMLTGYVISEVPLKFEDKDVKDADDEKMPPPPPPPIDAPNTHDGDAAEFSVTFNMDGDYEADAPDDMNDMHADVDFEELGELTREDRQAINNCRNLRVPRVYLDNMCPLDSSLKLEYSYRPLEKISQFWAGPSHWKFKQPRLSQNKNRASTQNNAQQRARTNKRNQLIEFREYKLYEEVFIKLDKYKERKANVIKKWDPKKLKLPSDSKLDTDMFFKYELAPGIPVEFEIDTQSISTHGPTEEEEEKGAEEEDEEEDVPGFAPMEDHFGEDDVPLPAGDPTTQDAPLDTATTSQEHMSQVQNVFHDSGFEIATSFEGAPETVNKIVIPFAKRAKVIDMKNLKRSCHKIIEYKLSMFRTAKETPPEQDLPAAKGEIYAPGAVKMSEVIAALPSLLTPAMQSSVSYSIALYAVLHVASEHSLHLFPNEDNTDAVIRRVVGRSDNNDKNNKDKD